MKRSGNGFSAKNPCIRVAACAALAIAFSGATQAADVIWDINGSAAGTGGTGNWASSFWTNNGIPASAWPGAANVAVFGGTAGTVTVGTQSASGLTFNTDGYSLTGGTLTLASGSTITTSGGATATLSSTGFIAGAAGATITKTGSGTFAMSVQNASLGTAASPASWTVTGGTYSSSTGIFDSILSIAFGSNLGATPTVATKQLTLDAGTLKVTGTALNPAIGATRTIQVNAAGGAIVDSNGNPYQGAIVDNAASNSSLYLSNASGTTTISGNITGTGGLTWNGAGTLALTGASNAYGGGTTINSGTVQFANDTQLGASAGAISLNGGTLASAQTANITLTHAINTGTTGGTIQLNNGTPSSGTSKITIGNTGQITGSGNITVKNNGLLSIGAANAGYSGNWTLNGGVTELSSGTAAGTGSISVNTGAQLTTLGSQINNALNLNGGTVAWDFFSGSGDYRGTTTLASGGGTVALSNFYGSGAMSGTISGKITGNGGLTTTATNTGNTTYGGVLTVSNTTNDYNGGTTIGTGTTLKVATGSSIGTGALSNSGTFDLNGNNVSVTALSSASGNFDFTLGTGGTPNKLSATSASLGGTSGIAINTASATSITPGTYTLISSSGGGLNGNVSFAGGQQLNVAATSSIQKIAGTNYRITLGTAANAVTATVAAAPAKVLSIMPLGSSITAGQSAQVGYNGGGYRSELYQNLVNDGRFTPTFAGSSVATLANGGASTDLMTTVGQTHHEGHPGYTTTQTLANLNGNDGSGGNNGGNWLAAGNGVNPDYITLNIGGNDFVANASDTTAIGRLDQILTQIATLRPNATVIVSSIMYRGDNNGAYGAGVNTYYNPLIPGVIYQHMLAGQHVEFLDLYKLITPSNSLANIGPDLVHPTQDGYNKIGDAWYNSLTTGQAFFTGAAGSTWNATGSGTTSWAMDYGRTTDAGAAPSASTDVYFNGGASGTTTLGQDFSIRSLNFAAGQTSGITIGGTNTLTIGSGGVTVQSGTGAHTITSKIALGADQTWSNVSNNDFTVTGNISGSGALTFGGTGRFVLGGSDNFGGLVTIGNGATIAAGGASANQLVFNGGLTNNGTLALRLFGNTNSDQINVAGGTFATGSGNIVVAFQNGFTASAGEQWDLLNWNAKSGTLSDTQLSLPTLTSGLNWDTSRFNSDGIIAITAVPEPAMVGLISAGALAGMTRRRRANH